MIRRVIRRTHGIAIFSVVAIQWNIALVFPREGWLGIVKPMNSDSDNDDETAGSFLFPFIINLSYRLHLIVDVLRRWQKEVKWKQHQTVTIQDYES